MNNSEIFIYQAADGKIKIDVRLEDETVRLTKDHIAGLFGKSKKTISEHICNIFSEGDLDDQVVVRNFRTTTRHGVMSDKTQSRDVQFYNLDVIISSSMDAGAIKDAGILRRVGSPITGHWEVMA